MDDTKTEVSDPATEAKAEDAPTTEGSVGEPVAPSSPEEIWASVMREMYVTVGGVVAFLAGNPQYGWIKSPNDIIFVASEFKTPEMLRPEQVGVMVVMGADMVKQVRAVLDGQKDALKPLIVH